VNTNLIVVAVTDGDEEEFSTECDGVKAAWYRFTCAGLSVRVKILFYFVALCSTHEGAKRMSE